MPKNPQIGSSSQHKSTFRVFAEFLTVSDNRNIVNCKKISKFENSLFFGSIFMNKLFIFIKIKTEIILFQILKIKEELITKFSFSEKKNKILFCTSKNNLHLFSNTGKRAFNNPKKKLKKFFKSWSIFNTKKKNERIISIGFDFSEKFVLISYKNEKIHILNLKGEEQKTIKWNTFFELKKAFLKDLTFGKLYGILNSNHFVYYDLFKKKFRKIFQFKIFEKFTIVKKKNQIEIFCLCHKIKIQKIFLESFVETFFFISDIKYFIFKKEIIFLCEINNFKKKICEFYPASKIFKTETKLTNPKIKKKNSSNFIFLFMIKKEGGNFEFFKPLSEKVNIFVNFNVFSSKLNKILDVKFFGGGNFFIIASNSNSIEIKTRKNFIHKGFFHYKKTLIGEIKTKGKILIALNNKGQIIVWDIILQDPIFCFLPFQSKLGVFSFLKLDKSNGFLITGEKNGIIKKWQIQFQVPIKTNLLLSNFSNKIRINSIAISANGKIIAISLINKKVFLWKCTQDSYFFYFGVFNRCVWALDFSPIDKTIVSGGGDGSVNVYCISTGHLLKKTEGHFYPVICCKFGFDGLLIFSSSSDGKIKIWRTDTAICVNTLSNHYDSIWNFDVSKNSTMLISGCLEGKIVILKDFGLEISIFKKKNLNSFVVLQKFFQKDSLYKISLKMIQKLISMYDPVLLYDFLIFIYDNFKETFLKIFLVLFQKVTYFEKIFFFRSLILWITQKSNFMFLQFLIEKIFSSSFSFIFLERNSILFEYLFFYVKKYFFKIKNLIINI
ncbi:tbl3 (nucleomorph) [Hemiselmis andersenii]|uniref:Tbl3 n=2 Tax=Hemiselmis andersenii TaxID=464988 RepID=A9BK78_HEMAN|nr:tbl3 [Hemiselmis andersenii]ABW97911.1 tbl3 [Hemiselmis andersenii]